MTKRALADLERVRQALDVAKAKPKGGRPPSIVTERDRAIAATIRSRRHARHMSQEALAKAAGVPVRSLKRYELAERALSVGVLARIEDVLGPCRPGEARTESVLPAQSRSRLSQSTRTVVALMERLTDAQRAEVVDYATTLSLGEEEEKPSEIAVPAQDVGGRR